jgi:hypothetical protein
VSTNVILKPTSPTLVYPSSSFSKLIFEVLQWNSFLSQGFLRHFLNPILSVPNLEFLLHYKVFQEGHDANHQASNPGDE